MSEPVRVILMGLGQVGCALARTVLGEPSLRLVGAVDNAAGLRGRRLSEVIDDVRGEPLRLAARLRDAPAADVVLIVTSSRLREVAPAVLDAAKRGMHVVSTCEELAHPWSVDPRLARRIDEAARAAGVSVLGVGVNPGFVLDRFALTLASATLGVERVCAERVVDLRTRRPALREKAGVGLSPRRFAAALRAGRLGHVGLEVSARLVAEGLGWAADRYVERLEPVLARRRLRGPGYDVQAGDVAGVRQDGVLLEKSVPRVLLRIELVIEAESPRDAVLVEARTPLRAEIPGGVPGDASTVAVVVRAASLVRAARPGILTPAELPAAPVPRAR